MPGFSALLEVEYFRAFPRDEMTFSPSEKRQAQEWDYLPESLAERAVVIAQDAAHKRGEPSMSLSYVIGVAKRLALAEDIAEPDPASVPDKWLAAYQRQKKRVAELQGIHGLAEHVLRFGCRGDVCRVGQKAPSGASQERMM